MRDDVVIHPCGPIGVEGIPRPQVSGGGALTL